MLLGLRAVSSWGCHLTLPVGLPVANDSVWCEHLMARHAVGLKFSLDIEQVARYECCLLDSLFRGDFSVTLV
jgi:hypothetical protein